MPWEKRGSKQYYYRSRRVGKGVVKDYFGSGNDARKAEKEDRDKRDIKSQIKKVAAQTRLAEELTIELGITSTLLMEAHLLLAGYWRPGRGKWRKRRARQSK